MSILGQVGSQDFLKMVGHLHVSFRRAFPVLGVHRLNSGSKPGVGINWDGLGNVALLMDLDARMCDSATLLVDLDARMHDSMTLFMDLDARMLSSTIPIRPR